MQILKYQFCIYQYIFIVKISIAVWGLAVMSVDFGSEWMKVAIVSVSKF